MEVKPWELDSKPPRRTAPQTLATDRSPAARQPGETIAAYKAFRAFLLHGSIRKAVIALDVERTLYERWSRRWRWPERKALVLRRVVGQYDDLLAYEERYGLPAATSLDELIQREMAAFTEISFPHAEANLNRLLGDVRENLRRINRGVGER